jgi:hypothetical protein
MLRALVEEPRFTQNSASPLRGDKRVFGIVDLKIERYPIAKGEKHYLLAAFKSGGVVGQSQFGWFVFSADQGIRPATQDQIQSLPKLPSMWEKYMTNVL